MTNRTLWMALGAGLLAGASIAAYRARQRSRQSAVGPEYLDRWKGEAASSDASSSVTGAGSGASVSPLASRPLSSGNGAQSAI